MHEQPGVVLGRLAEETAPRLPEEWPQTVADVFSFPVEMTGEKGHK
jgi:hypothetical protein